MQRKFRTISLSVTLAMACGPWNCVGAQVPAEPSEPLDAVQITATREPELIDHVPASISIVTGAELRRRGATDLRTALSLTGGVEGTPGGDGGPAGSVPALWGLREADAFLLVVDGVPWGGAFNPATPSLDLTGVERLEILRGAAPVMFGATAFVGVIHVIHYAAGSTPATIGFAGGSGGSYGVSASLDLPSTDNYRQSLTVNLENRGFMDDRTEFSRYHALYRSTRNVSAARLHLDADVSILPQHPAGNLLLRDGPVLHTELPRSANYNPAGAKLNQRRFHLATGLDGAAAVGRWTVNLAVTRTLDDTLRGFLRGEAFTAPADAGVGDGLQADGYSQTRTITDVYFDAHITNTSGAVNLTYGVDFLHGSGAQHAANFGYCIDISGSELSCAGARHADELVRSDDRRDFAGLYSQLDWKLGPRVDVLAGVRLNHTRESASGRALDNTGPVPVVAFEGKDALSRTRGSGVLGASWRAWAAAGNALTWYADYRNSYKPLAIDFGPEAEVEVLKPETADSYEAGAKLQLLDGRLDVDASVFRMDFKNGLTFADDGNGNFGRANGAETRFQGFEIEARYQLSPQLQLATHYANHDARFRRFRRDNGADAAGNRIEMSPRQLAGAGLLYTAATGLSGSVIANYVGARKLNKSNSVQAGGYTTLDASLSYPFDRYRLQFNGYNLSNRRDPVAESELNEAVTVTGTAGYYRLPARSYGLALSRTL